MARVHRGLDEDVHDDGSQVRERESSLSPPFLRLSGGIVEATGGNDLVGASDGGAVGLDDRRNRLITTHDPVTVVTLGPEVERLAGDDHLEPVTLVGEGEVPHQTDAGPT